MAGGDSRGTIAFSSGRPLMPFDIFACPVSAIHSRDEVHLTDGISHNYNCRPIPPVALKTLLKRPKLVAEVGATEADVDGGQVCGFVFVSERDDGLETLYVALHLGAVGETPPKVFSMAEIFGSEDFSGARLEDSGCFAGGYTVGSHTVDHCIVYVSTKEPAGERRSPWTAVYKTSLRTGKTDRLTPQGVSDLSPAVSPSGRFIAVASFQRKNWYGEIDKLDTDIYVMDVDSEGTATGRGRRLVITDGGWPSWGSDDVIFFHRGVRQENRFEAHWGVLRYCMTTEQIIRVTPEDIDAMTPAAISETKLAVATVRQKSNPWILMLPEQYRHIEIFDMTKDLDRPARITINIRPKGHHFNPFVLDGGSRIGYHRCIIKQLLFEGNGHIVPRSNFEVAKLQTPESHKDIDLISMFALYPSISKDGSMLAFIDRECRAVWLADNNGLRLIYQKTRGQNSLFAVSWNQNPNKDTLYVCVGPNYNVVKAVEIYAILNASKPRAQRRVQQLTAGGFNNSFPSSSPDGNKLVFASTRYTGDKGEYFRQYKNLYIMEDAEIGEFGDSDLTRLTYGPWTDIHCQWSPNGDWIVFSSSRDRPSDAPVCDILDEGCYAVFLVKATDPTVVVRVIKSSDDLRGHVQFPVFSADGRSIAVAADLAAVSAEPISLPRIIEGLRCYHDIFVVDIDTEDLTKNKDVRRFHRITHSRYECSKFSWTAIATDNQKAHWNMLLPTFRQFEPIGNLSIPRRFAC